MGPIVSRASGPGSRSTPGPCPTCCNGRARFDAPCPWRWLIPRACSHRVSVRLPLEPDEPPPNVEVKDPAFRFALDSRVSGATLTATLTYESLADAVSRADLPRYLADLDQARAQLTLPLARPTGHRAARRRMLATLAAAPALFVAWVLFRRRRRRSARLEPA